MTTSAIFQDIPCTLVTGFLGAGKTTVINQLIATKPTDERWSLLINEFGRIGIDGAILANSQDNNAEPNNIAIREVRGGCICCTSQLPLQIAISRLLSEHHPQRLLIEPTGLAHPRELIQQLSAPHWQTALKMQSVMTVLSGVQWQQEKYRSHDGFQAHVRDADVLIINRYHSLLNSEKQALVKWIIRLNSQVKTIWAPPEQTTSDFISASNAYVSELTTQLYSPSLTVSKQRKINIAPLQASNNLQPRSHALTASSSQAPREDDTQNSSSVAQPYRYHDQQQDLLVAGWQLPAHYKLPADELQRWLLNLPNWRRIKGVVHTANGWLQINFTPDSLSTVTVSAQLDNRLEVILQRENRNDIAMIAANTGDNTEFYSIDWEAYNRELMALVL